MFPHTTSGGKYGRDETCMFHITDWLLITATLDFFLSDIACRNGLMAHEG